MFTLTVEDYNNDNSLCDEKKIMRKLDGPKRSASLLACVLEQYGFKHYNIDQQKTNEDCLTQINNILIQYSSVEIENIVLYLSGKQRRTTVLQ